MKNIVYILKLAFVSFLISGCTDQFDEINRNDHEHQTATPELLFPGVVKKTLDFVNGQMEDRMFLQYSHYVSVSGGDFANYFYTDVTISQWWNNSYVDILNNNQSIIDAYKEDSLYTNRVQMAEIWKGYVMSVVVGTWGPAPYDQALRQSLSIDYESEQDIVEGVLSHLNEAYIKMGEGVDTMNDPIFQGDIQKWRKFANTLMLKLALRYQYTSAEIVDFGKLAMSREADLIADESETVKAAWGPAEENWNHFYRAYIHTNPILSLRLNHFFLMYMRDLKDPRISAYADAPVQDYIVQDTVSRQDGAELVIQYAAPFVGRPKTPTADNNWAVNDQFNPYSGYGQDSYSNISQEYYAKDFAPTIISYAEACFLKAEAKLLHWGGGKDAKQYYEEGIQASLTSKGMGDKYMEYIQNDGVAWGSSSNGVNDFRNIVNSKIDRGPFQQVITQRWIASFFQGFDAWCLIRRTNVFDVPPHFNAVSRIGLPTEMPERMLYPSIESRLNSVGYQQGLSYLGGVDYLDVPLELSTPKTPKDWSNMIPTMNTEAIQYWYGNTIEEVDASGVEYRIVEEL
ncbi:SusD/RagB family nutrient-binding outer membrane lipoprotein [Flammeovirga sp. MY04]|uniref:SusD/RagB family nutrient-binding outer membrane lipoprotein n=1 Tax=Flammeovirga sp. MY04 TaxID=1191459 RepID=UPI00080624CE|nr:SusD/RagB family nutrient-binding outer membrane lipoprotein [Flammeovirga sp. MY04]ANQ52810.1 SusD/RagB family nutrient-binding outer membrane lipoprotein [Flammeovirga sp. MY04]